MYKWHELNIMVLNTRTSVMKHQVIYTTTHLPILHNIYNLYSQSHPIPHPLPRIHSSFNPLQDAGLPPLSLLSYVGVIKILLSFENFMVFSLFCDVFWKKILKYVYFLFDFFIVILAIFNSLLTPFFSSPQV